MTLASMRFSVVRVLVPGAIALLAACKGTSPESATPTSPKPAEVVNEFTATATVVSLAPAERRLVLRREDGVHLEVQAGERVRNFDQIKVGDALRIRYRETLTARLCEPGEDLTTLEGGVLATRAAPGEKPGAGVGATIRLRVRIESIDRDREIVTFSLPSGELIARRIQTPQGREFVRGLAVDDAVQLDITSLLALSIEKP